MQFFFDTFKLILMKLKIPAVLSNALSNIILIYNSTINDLIFALDNIFSSL